MQTLNVNRLRILRRNLQKVNNLIPSFMNDLSDSRETQIKFRYFKWNKKTFGYKRLKVLDPKIWNNLPYHIKSSENLVFKFAQAAGWNLLQI